MSNPQRDPSGANPTLSSATGIRLTLPEFVSVLVVVAFAVLGWARLDQRLSRLEDRAHLSDHLAINPIPKD